MCQYNKQWITMCDDKKNDINRGVTPEIQIF